MDHNYGIILFWVLVSFSAALSAGYAAGKDHPYVATALCVGTIPPFVGVCRAACVDFGPSGITRHQSALHWAIALSFGLVLGPAFGFLYEYTENTTIQISVAVACLIACGFGSAVCGGRAGYFVATLGVAPRGLYGIIFSREGAVGYNPWYGWVLAPWLFCTAFVRYKKDQCTLGMLGVATANCVAWGHSLASRPEGSTFFVVVLMVVSYGQLLWVRRGRQLPPGLRGCKFVTLEYLRRVAASGEGIKRCQDLPPDAFGHPHKARYVLTVSHRWLDRYTCDVATDTYPQGTRLQTMVNMLDDYFSLKGLGKGKGFFRRMQRFSMAVTGGRDVVLFFDFMSLPQETLDDDGSVKPRTPEEQALFAQCLPNMGALYSMLPVLVCEHVTPGFRSYLESGWCFTEVATAWLGRQLTKYSSTCGAAQWLQEKTHQTKNDWTEFAKFLDEQVREKHFLREDDRAEVRNILGGFLTKNRLVRALQSKSRDDLADVLTSDVFKVSNLLDQAIDSSLNTPLHLAVAINFPEGVRLLLEAGARRDLRNHRGDLPVEFFMLPRLSIAAFTCRKLVILQTLKRTSGIANPHRSSGKDCTDNGNDSRSEYKSDANSSCSAGTLHASSLHIHFPQAFTPDMASKSPTAIDVADVPLDSPISTRDVDWDLENKGADGSLGDYPSNSNNNNHNGDSNISSTTVDDVAVDDVDIEMQLPSIPDPNPKAPLKTVSPKRNDNVINLDCSNDSFSTKGPLAVSVGHAAPYLEQPQTACSVDFWDYTREAARPPAYDEVEFFMLPRLSRAAFTCRKLVILQNLKRSSCTVDRPSFDHSSGKDCADSGNDSKSEYKSDANSSCSAGTLHASTLHNSNNNSNFAKLLHAHFLTQSPIATHDVDGVLGNSFDDSNSNRKSKSSSNKSSIAADDVDIDRDDIEMQLKNIQDPHPKALVNAVLSKRNDEDLHLDYTSDSFSTKDTLVSNFDNIKLNFEQPNTACSVNFWDCARVVSRPPSYDEVPHWAAGTLVESL